MQGLSRMAARPLSGRLPRAVPGFFMVPGFVACASGHPPGRSISKGMIEAFSAVVPVFLLIGLGVAGVLMPATSAMLHNLSTIAISLRSMTNLMPAGEAEKPAK